MYNETQRKITSLTLMTIMLAGGMVIAAPGMDPAHAANANLFVSTNTFGGPMIVEIMVNDPSYKDDNNESMPSVSIDGNDLVMAQGSDGNWYAYVADRKMADYADSNPTGLDFGTRTTTSTDVLVSGSPITVPTDTVVYVSDSTQNVLKSPKSLDINGDTNKPGQIQVKDGVWPFIQTFVFTDDSNIKVIYETTPSQTETIIYDEDMDDLASYSTDRTSYPHSADIHLVIDDMQLNIDPTDEDIWTFNVLGGNQTSYYGTSIDGLTPADQNSLFYDTNGFFSVDPNGGIIIFDDNLDSITPNPAYTYVTVEEDGVNSGLFENTDSANNANMRLTDDTSIRDKSGIFDYNDDRESILVGFFTGKVVMDASSVDEDWGSGEKLTVTVNDQDQNTNTKTADDFDVSDGIVGAIPTIEIGNPFTLASYTGVSVTGIADTTDIDNSISIIDDRLVELGDFIPSNQTAVDLIHANHGTDDLMATVITEQDNVNAANEALVSSIKNGLDSALIDGFKTDVDNANAALKSAEDALDTEIKLFDSDEKDQLKELDDLLAEELRITSERDALSDSKIGADSNIPLTNSVLRPFSKMLNINTQGVTVDLNPTFTIKTGIDSSILNDLDIDGVHRFINYDFRSLDPDNIELRGSDNGSYDITNNQGLRSIADRIPDDFEGELLIIIETSPTGESEDSFNVIFDVFTFGQDDKGNRYNDAIYRAEATETTTNSGIYSATVEYVMLNQINIFDDSTFSTLKTISDTLEIIVHEDLTDEDAVSLIYYDTNKSGNNEQVSAKIDASTHSAVISFDKSNYKVADTVTITVDDRDLNTESGTVDIYTPISETDTIAHLDFPNRSQLLEIEFNGKPWADICDGPTGMYANMGTLIETGKDTGIFTASFQIPKEYCISDSKSESVTGLDIQVNYVDFRDASGEEIEVGASAGVGASTGSISLDRTVYPVPFGIPSETPEDQDGSYFAVHATSADSENPNKLNTFLKNGDLTIHVRVNDPDFDISASGEDKISEPDNHGPVRVLVSRGSESVLLGTAGAKVASGDKITIGSTIESNTRELGPITEIAPDAGIFEFDLTIRYTDGPASSTCPASVDLSHIVDKDGDLSGDKHCILQGDILQVEYTDPTDASGDKNTVTDSATFDLRNGVLQADKSVYIIGSDMILTLIEPDFDLDNDQAESFSLDLVEWDSDAGTITMGSLGDKEGIFDPEPSLFRETGDSTGIFQVVVEIPSAIDGDNLERGEAIDLEYTDWGPSGADYVGDEDEDVNLLVFTSNFGATIELDQKVYTWTDKVYITIVAPDHNFDRDLVDEIGNTEDDPIKISTRSADIDNYKLVETGTDTGIFTGEIILTGFRHNADGDSTTGDVDGIDVNPGEATGNGPTDGYLPASDDDGLTVSFEFSEKDIAMGSALIRWNVGEVQWLEASYPASGTGLLRVIDPDMNLDPEAVDNFNADVWSDSDAGGIDLTVTETNEATGIFEGTVFFTTTDDSSGHRLRVSEGDTVIAEYEDNTLPDPYTTADELDITATTIIGTLVPPLERAPAANLRTVDAFGNSLDSVTVDQQVQLTADLNNGQDREQTFAYLVQIQDGDGVTVSLAWITGSLSEGQTFSPALSWIPTTSGSFTATAFVWESVDNPTALSPPVSTTIRVS